MSKQVQWSVELKKLRELLVSTEMQETVKWGIPTYTIDGTNVVGLSGFKSYFGLWFFQGVFLADKKQLLINAQEDLTKGMRQMRFTNLSQIDSKVILSYLKEAIQNAKEGKAIKPEKKTVSIPPLLGQLLKKDKLLNAAFQKFTSSRQKEFYEFIGSAKRESTQNKRLEETIALIKIGKSPMDKYR